MRQLKINFELVYSPHVLKARIKLMENNLLDLDDHPVFLRHMNPFQAKSYESMGIDVEDALVNEVAGDPMLQYILVAFEGLVKKEEDGPQNMACRSISKTVAGEMKIDINQVVEEAARNFHNLICKFESAQICGLLKAFPDSDGAFIFFLNQDVWDPYCALNVLYNPIILEGYCKAIGIKKLVVGPYVSDGVILVEEEENLLRRVQSEILPLYRGEKFEKESHGSDLLYRYDLASGDMEKYSL